MYSLRSKTSPFPCNVAVPFWVPCPPNFRPPPPPRRRAGAFGRPGASPAPAAGEQEGKNHDRNQEHRPPFTKHSSIPLHESASVPHLLAGRPPGLLDYRQLNGERREPPPQEKPPEPEADPLPRGLNREMTTRR